MSVITIIVLVIAAAAAAMYGITLLKSDFAPVGVMIMQLSVVMMLLAERQRRK